MNRALIPAIAAILLLGGCSASNATYESPSALHAAYVDAGNECDDPADVPESLIGKGAHAVLCPNVVMLIVFDSTEQKNRYLAQVLDGKNGNEAVTGERWVVVTDDAKALAPELGGEVKTG